MLGRLFTAASAGSTLAVAACVALVCGSPAIADTAQSTVVSDNPVNFTPNILDGTVRGVAVVGNEVVVGGSFTRVQKGDTTYTRNKIFAFDKNTGAVEQNFTPSLNGDIYQLAAGPNNTVYAAGTFTDVDGTTQSGVTQLNVSDGSRVAAFKGHVNNGYVRTVVRHGNDLYIGGSFTKVEGEARTVIARLNATTGAVDENFDLNVSDPTSSQSALKVMKLAVNPAGTRLAFDGTFTTVNGESRPRIAMADISGSAAELADWRTSRYAASCPVDVYTRGIDFSPDGSYFVVVTTGGPTSPYSTLCDSAQRWETGSTGSDIQPTWVNYTGGDSLYEVSVTGAAVYVGGHQRWLDNPYGNDSAGPGAVSRPGIGAIDPSTGKALSWNPTKERGHGVEALVASNDGLYVGSDTEIVHQEYRKRIAEFPLN